MTAVVQENKRQNHLVCNLSPQDHEKKKLLDAIDYNKQRDLLACLDAEIGTSEVEDKQLFDSSLYTTAQLMRAYGISPLEKDCLKICKETFVALNQPKHLRVQKQLL